MKIGGEEGQEEESREPEMGEPNHPESQRNPQHPGRRREAAVWGPAVTLVLSTLTQSSTQMNLTLSLRNPSQATKKRITIIYLEGVKCTG